MLGERDPYAMVDEMQKSRPGLFEDWVEMFCVEPFGPQALNLMLARVCAATAGGNERGYLPGIVDG